MAIGLWSSFPPFTWMHRSERGPSFRGGRELCIFYGTRLFLPFFLSIILPWKIALLPHRMAGLKAYFLSVIPERLPSDE